MKFFFALVLMGTAAAVASAETSKAVDPGAITPKVSMKQNDEFAVEFTRDGDQLRRPAKSRKADAKEVVRVKLAVTTDSPVPPPREGATRPYLSVENHFEKTLHFRALVRMKGSKEFVKLTEDMKSVAAGETFLKCWSFDDQVEEVVLYEFKLSDKADN